MFHVVMAAKDVNHRRLDTRCRGPNRSGHAVCVLQGRANGGQLRYAAVQAIRRSVSINLHGREIPKLSTRGSIPSPGPALQHIRSRVRCAGSRWGTASGMGSRLWTVRGARNGCLQSPHSSRLRPGARWTIHSGRDRMLVRSRIGGWPW